MQLNFGENQLNLRSAGSITLTEPLDQVLLKQNGSPGEYTLRQNMPNPFNPTTMLSFDLPEEALVTLKVYNVLGQEVATLLDHEQMEAGTREVQFNAGSLSSGVYVYRIIAQGIDDEGVLSSNNFTSVMKMLLVK